MNDFLVKYLIGWVAFCVLAVVLALKDVRLNWSHERAFLTVPWKLAVFVPAILFVTFAGHWTDDETWDAVTGFGMSAFTFLTAGWSVGTLYKVAKRERPLSHAVVAIAVMLFASSWFYDGWLLFRDGAYTRRWLGNLRLSPIIYVCAGLLLNLEVGGFGFTRADWPKPSSKQISAKMVLAAVPLVLVAAYVLVAYVGWHFNA